MTERWLPVPGFPGYAVSDCGRVMGLLRWKKPRVLTPARHSKGYFKYGLAVDGKCRTVLAHRLVALAFLPNPLGHAQVNHKNLDKTDNRLENLEWVSHAQNIAHAKAKGVYPTGLDHHNARLSDAQVIEMHALRRCGLSGAAIARRFGIQKDPANRILSGKARTAVYKAMLAASPKESR